jgi:hypothetical protein
MNSYFEREALALLKELDHRVKHIERLLNRPHFTAILTQEDTMAIGNIAAGSSGTFAATLLENGSPYVPPVGSTYAPVWTYSSSDSTATFVTTPDTTSTVLSVPSNDLGTSLAVGASAIAPDGSTVTTALDVTLTPGVVTAVFAASLTQTA